MAKKNIMSQENGQYYATMAAVEQNVENYMSLVNGVKTKDSDFIRMLVDHLYKLVGILHAQERAFYSTMGLTGANELRYLQQRVNDWNSLGASVLFENKTIADVYELVASQVEEAGLLKLVNEYLSEQSDWLLTEIITDPNMDQEITEVFSQLLNGKFNKGPKGLGAQLELHYHNKKYSVTTKQNTKMSGSMKGKILKLLREKYEKDPIINAAAIAEADSLMTNLGDYDTVSENIISYLNNRIPNYTVASFIANEIRRQDKSGKKLYARWANFFVIKGYLGELYWNACMNYIFTNGKQDIRALGNVKNLGGKSLSVDMFVNGAGFQIKSWSLKEVAQESQIFQTHTSNNNMYFGRFIKDRAQILEQEAGQFIARMFGSMSYNKPNPSKHPELLVGENDEPYSQFYNEADAEWPRTMDDLATLFRANLSEILGISGKGGYTEDEVYYNTFWAINDKIIPSSLIIEELIDSIQNVSQTQLVTFEVSLHEVKKTPTWDAIKGDFSDLTMANRWKIDYSTCFNMTKLLEAAARKA